MLEFKSNQVVCGVDFGYQMVDRWYTISKVPSPFGELTMHFAPPQSSQNFQQYLYMCAKPQVPVKRKCVIFFFDSDELETIAQRRFPFTVALKNITDDMLRQLTDCEIARVKVCKGDVTFYIYAVKWRGRTFARSQELCDLLEKLLNMDDIKDCIDYSPPNRKFGVAESVTSLGRSSIISNRAVAAAAQKDQNQEQRSQEKSSQLFRFSKKEQRAP